MVVDSACDWGEMAIRLGAAVVLGAAIGLNRDLHDKPAGLKTHALVSLGAALVVLFAARISGAADTGGVTRVVQGIITGVGFVGGGVILRPSGGEPVRGLTTASTIWVVACLGAACGGGEWPLALLASGLVATVLVAGGPIERGIHRHFLRGRQPEGVAVELPHPPTGAP